MRIRTTAGTEEHVRNALSALSGQYEGKAIFKWHVLRVALGMSLADEDVPPFSRETYDIGSVSGGGDYRLKEITGAGKSAQDDFTDAIRAMLGVLHGRDLYHPATGADDFAVLLAWHLERGSHMLAERAERHGDIYACLHHWIASHSTSAAPAIEPLNLEPIRRALRDLGVKGTVSADVLHGPRLDCVRIELASARDMTVLTDGLEKLAFILGKSSNTFAVAPGDAPRVANLFIARAPDAWRVPGNADLERWCDESDDDFILPMCPGTDVFGSPIWFDLARGPHLLVAGATRSGKSVCVRSLLMSLLRRRPTDVLRLCLLDPKKVELTEYASSGYLWDRVGLAAEINDIADALRMLEQEMDARYSAFEHQGVRNIEESRAAGDSMPYLIVVVDELADLVLQSKTAEQSLVRLAQKGRAAGLHLVLSTQRPDAKTFSGLLRSNVDSRIALAVDTNRDSRIVLDRGGAERLLKPGDGLMKLSGSSELVRLHCPMVE